MRKSVGYFEGTDSKLLTALVCDGYDTLPVSNGFDNHGMHVRLINDQNRFDLLVFDLFTHLTRDQHCSGYAQTLYPRSYIHAISVDVVFSFHNIAQMNANTQRY